MSQKKLCSKRAGRKGKRALEKASKTSDNRKNVHT